MSDNNGNGKQPEQEARKMSAEEKYDYALQGLMVLAECMVQIEDGLQRAGLALDALNRQLGPDAKARMAEAQKRIITL